MTDKTMTLEPCPFCGCKDNLGRVYSGTHDEYCVQCFDCDARGPVHTDDDDACGAWSSRHLSQTAERPCSLSEALNVIEHWGRRGNTLQSDDVARLRALTDKIAPAERGEAVACDLYVECRQCEDCTHIGINDASETASACGDCEWQGSMPAGDKCPGCAHENCMAVACPICGGRYQFLVDRKFVAPPPAAGVPDVRSDAENWGNALNDASWLFVDVCPEKSALLFNHAKASLRAAILKYLDLVSAAPSSAIDVAAVRSISEILRAVSKGSERWRSSDSSNPSTLDISLLADKLARAIGDAK